ncbi:MAG: tyrosine-type recombinase/integrase [Bacteroidetes bacterium]|nr:tyrosine-type recombinase/integrase [Bacteroidota bacterium]
MTGNKDRYTILSQKALEQLRFYYKYFRPSVWLFETSKGVAMSERTIQQVFKNALGKSGITKTVSIHSLRHSFATHLMEQGVSLAIIQQHLDINPSHHQHLFTCAAVCVEQSEKPIGFLSRLRCVPLVMLLLPGRCNWLLFLQSMVRPIARRS